MSFAIAFGSSLMGDCNILNSIIVVNAFSALICSPLSRSTEKVANRTSGEDNQNAKILITL
jgi:hypothetical protein